MLERRSLPHSLHNGFSLNFQVQRFVGVGYVSYTELMAKRILLDSIFQSISHGSFLDRTDSNPSQLPLFFLATALVIRVSSLPCRTSPWTSSLWHCFDAEVNLLLVIHPCSSRPFGTVTMMSLCVSLSSADLTASSTCLFFRNVALYLLRWRICHCCLEAWRPASLWRPCTHQLVTTTVVEALSQCCIGPYCSDFSARLDIFLGTCLCFFLAHRLCLKVHQRWTMVMVGALVCHVGSNMPYSYLETRFCPLNRAIPLSGFTSLLCFLCHTCVSLTICLSTWLICCLIL